MNITQQDLEQLRRIYNTLLLVETKGENSFFMADAVRALGQFIENYEQKIQEARSIEE